MNKIDSIKEFYFIKVGAACMGVTDLINRIVQVLRRDLRQVRISAQDAELMEPVEPWDEG